ncbi:helix-turn-helix transcriptional regulator [Streptomyces sp. NPDC094032]|uniref:helix-turn-helix domain-containing protein n=1 Tax=Streptomyces sp. NPDC094032 TaxID=3155308 RepID=UPI003333767E
MPKDAEVEQFARLVRELKARDGRSYEALGRRLNVSASTLHRYCSGTTVPEDFAVIDRLAALCGAEPEEHQALEEAWKAASRTRHPPEPEPEAPPQPQRRRRWHPALPTGLLALTATLALTAVLLPRQSKTPPPPPPLTVTTASHIWQNGCGHTYLAAQPPAQVPAPPPAADASRWAAAQAAVHGGETLLRVSVQGKNTSAVVLQGLHVRVVDRGRPLPWSAYRMDGGCGGAITPRLLEVDLDRPRPVTRPVDGYDASGAEGRTIPAVSFPYAVTAADPEELLVSARTAACDCRWYLELEWTADGRRGTVRIADEQGEPFRTSGTKNRPTYGYDSTRRTWITAPESGQAG